MLKRYLWMFLLLVLLGANVISAQELTPSSLPNSEELQARYAGFMSRAQTEGEISVIVGLATGLQGQAMTEEAVQSQQAAIQSARADLVSSLQAFNAEVSANSLQWAIPYVAMKVDAAGLQALLASPLVTVVEEDMAIYNVLASSVPVVNGDDAWARGYLGAGQTVAVIDSGVERTHSFFGGRVVAEACYSGNGSTGASLCPNGQLSQTGTGAAVPGPCAATPYDDCSHGTHVAGIMAGNGPSFDGVAPSASIIAVNASSRPSSGSRVTYWFSDIISGLNYIYGLRNTYNIAAVNMSLGGGSNTTYCDSALTAFKSAVDLLRNVQILSVIATGNNGFTNMISTPACISSAVSVGATQDNDAIASFSNRAPIMTMFAPGVDITSSVLGNTFASFNGTSMATPHVAGALAVMRSARPGATAGEMYQALTGSGPWINVGGQYSRRRLDVNGAINYLQADMITNGNFSAGATGWSPFPSNQIVTRFTNGMMEYYRNTGAASASILQSTGDAVPNGASLRLSLLLGNSSAVRKRVSVLVHDGDFSDLQICSFWLAPGQPLRNYLMYLTTTEAWTNATISFYISQADSQGWVQVDNVSMRYLTGYAPSNFCEDPNAPAGGSGSTSPNLLSNSGFDSPIGNGNGNWGVFGQIQQRISGGVFEFYKLAGTPAGVVLQNSGDPVPSGRLIAAGLQLGNSSSQRMRATVLLHDSDFSDLNVCTFWIPAGSPLQTYEVWVYTTEAWTNAAISVYPSTVATSGWLRMDNVGLYTFPQYKAFGTECYPPTGSGSPELSALTPPTLEPTATVNPSSEGAAGVEGGFIATATPVVGESASTGEGTISEGE